MGINRRLSNADNWMNGTQGVNLGYAMFNNHHDDVNRNNYPVSEVEYKADLEEDKVKLSYDDDFFQASFWHRYYRICNRKHRIERLRASERKNG